MTESELSQSITRRLLDGSYECVVCTEHLGLRDKLWTCNTCFGVFHLPCIMYWAKSQVERQKNEAQHSGSAGVGATIDSFRCPLCQSRATVESTKEYRCYCKKVLNPNADPTVVLGSCGQTCGKRRADPDCPHTCSLACHPGPCPPCGYYREQQCFCGADEKQVGCSSDIHGFECGAVCGKELNCGRHYCERLCHSGDCSECSAVVEVRCYCGAVMREKLCAADVGFSCNQPCPKKRDCGVHACGLMCHEGPCNPCTKTPARQASCPCGQTPLWKLYYENPQLQPRNACTDPIPVCGKTCSMPLGCGDHFCSQPCHDSACPPCLEMVSMPCRCGASNPKKYPCFVTYVPQSEWHSICERMGINERQLPASYPIVCQKRCKRPLSCGRHQCEEVCCSNTDHTCYQVCKKRAPCGIHDCGQLCHKGPCPRCLNTSYERLYCRCRRTFVEPPIPCGTPPPNCLHPCSIPRPCGHPPNHVCHLESTCPDCVVPTQKYCGSHGKPMPYLMACFMTTASCGHKCEKVILSGSERVTICQRICHSGPCDESAAIFPTLGVGRAGSAQQGQRNAWGKK